MPPLHQNIYIGQGGRATIMAPADLRPRALRMKDKKKVDRKKVQRKKLITMDIAIEGLLEEAACLEKAAAAEEAEVMRKRARVKELREAVDKRQKVAQAKENELVVRAKETEDMDTTTT
ncbi:uncharacterized protein BO97DRAFT_411429 [Aspergillus homomorphus CBS 101889]|uniref:Uncharacterized protein n=1 Tax=Aspergillus homomorphus (strain CBS 101889) TaxID=1450537 RepID=A0A395IAL9_ASPHC|nr:hypothetical protein BO97DRAFT_411429 [Aspergillus homomorphus CBS 101889]RAL16193.1 hypothetical protein BO97DRAFT_411429 [Aspergillus homomorphus CBS 101889]